MVKPIKKKKNANSTKKKDNNDADDVDVSVQNRISDRLTRSVNSASLSKKNRSPELIPLAVEWETTKKKLRLLVSMTKDYGESTRIMQASRSKLVNHLGLLSDKSPIFDSVGKQTLNTKSTTLALISILEDPLTKMTVAQVVKEQQKSSEGTTVVVNSVEALQQLATTQEVVQQREYRTQVVDYAMEWEKTVSERVEGELKKVRILQTSRSHYEKKVEQLRQRTNELEKKGKTNTVAQAERLERNEKKLKDAFSSHETEAGRLCVLIEEATTNGWKDLYHLVENYCKWETNRVDQESDIYSQLLPTTLDSMKSTFKKNSSKKKKSK